MKEEEKRNWRKPTCVGPNKRKEEKKTWKEKEGTAARGVIFGLLFLTLAAPNKKGAFIL